LVAIVGSVRARNLWDQSGAEEFGVEGSLVVDGAIEGEHKLAAGAGRRLRSPLNDGCAFVVLDDIIGSGVAYSVEMVCGHPRPDHPSCGQVVGWTSRASSTAVGRR